MHAYSKNPATLIEDAALLDHAQSHGEVAGNIFDFFAKTADAATGRDKDPSKGTYAQVVAQQKAAAGDPATKPYDFRSGMFFRPGGGGGGPLDPSSFVDKAREAASKVPGSPTAPTAPKDPGGSPEVPPPGDIPLPPESLPILTTPVSTITPPSSGGATTAIVIGAAALGLGGIAYMLTRKKR